MEWLATYGGGHFFLQNLKPSAVIEFDNNFVHNFEALSCCYTLQEHLSHFNFGWARHSFECGGPKKQQLQPNVLILARCIKYRRIKIYSFTLLSLWSSLW